MIYAPVADSAQDKAQLAVAELRAAKAAMRQANTADAVTHLEAARAAATRAAEQALEAIETLNRNKE